MHVRNDSMVLTLRMQEKDQIVPGVAFTKVTNDNPFDQVSEEIGAGALAWIVLAILMSCITICIVNMNNAIRARKARTAQALLTDDLDEINEIGRDHIRSNSGEPQSPLLEGSIIDLDAEAN